MRSSRLLKAIALVGSSILASTSAYAAQSSFTVDPGANWLGFMNVYELPSNGGGFVFASGWGTADLTATFSGNVLTLGPNTIGDPHPFWYVGGGGPGAQGNKTMEANMYVEDNSIFGNEVTFHGTVLANTFVSPYATTAFIRDFAPDYSSFNFVSVPLTPGNFSITLQTDPTPGRHVQYGFTTTGPNVWITDTGPVGNAQITATVVVPEPATIGVLALAGIGALARRRA